MDAITEYQLQFYKCQLQTGWIGFDTGRRPAPVGSVGALSRSYLYYIKLQNVEYRSQNGFYLAIPDALQDIRNIAVLGPGVYFTMYMIYGTDLITMSI